MCGLYIHIPFCKQKCKYCDFYSLPLRSNIIDKYINALKREIDYWSIKCSNKFFDSLFIGGGTPSVLGDKLCFVVDYALKSFNFAENSEITVEANPESLSAELAVSLRKSGVNRISIGAQSFDDEQLKIIGRIHDSNQIESAVSNIKDAGFDNFNIDLMFALPVNSNKSSLILDIWKNTVEKALSLNPTHISAYSLTLEEHTPLYRDTEKYYFPSEDEEDDMYRYLCDKLQDSGYSHYEISNYALNGRECRHNLKYWRHEEYLGIGPAAHSFMDGYRFYYNKDLANFILGNDTLSEYDKITELESVKEQIMTGLRTKYGVSLDLLNEQSTKELIEMLKKNNLATVKNNSLILTEQGYRVSNDIINRIFDCKKIR